jgi:hypothetical protein
MIRNSAQRFLLATNPQRVGVEIMRQEIIRQEIIRREIIRQVTFDASSNAHRTSSDQVSKG